MIVLKPLQPYKIKKHDIIKLGRVLFKVADMRVSEIEQ
jgi:hypothetical protein